MGAICGIIDLNSEKKESSFELLRRMWCASAPLGRAYAYMNNGFSVCCDRQKSAFCSLPCSDAKKKGENCTLVLDCSPPFPSYTRDLLVRYLHDGAEALCELKDKASFVLFDEANDLLMISSARTPFFFTHEDARGRFFFSTDQAAVSALLESGADLHFPSTKLCPHGIAMYCNISAETKREDRSQR